MTGVDPDGTQFVIPIEILDSTAALLAEPGSEGFEGAALWIGTVLTPHRAVVTKVHRPEQIAHATPSGLAVTLTEDGLTDLIRSLAGNEIVLARLHTHGTEDVDHSDVDDRNLVVAHPGAVSIVVPSFAADGIDLEVCGVHVLSATHRWRRLSNSETRERFLLR